MSGFVTYTTPFLKQFIREDGTFDPKQVAQFFALTNEQLMSLLGIDADAMSTNDGQERVQIRLREMLEIIDTLLDWAGGAEGAMYWYRSQPIPSCGDLTPQQLVNSNRASLVKLYLESYKLGGYA